MITITLGEMEIRRLVEAILYTRDMREDNLHDMGGENTDEGRDERAEIEALNQLLDRLDPSGQIRIEADVTDGTGGAR
jgi:hypothetical protein